MIKLLNSGWRKPEKPPAFDALEAGSKLGMRSWVLPRELLVLGSRRDQSTLVSRARAQLGGCDTSGEVSHSVLPPSLSRRLGSGAFGTVYKCKYKGEPAVAKQIAPLKLASKDLPLLQNEMCLWSQLSHENCVKFYGVVFDPTDFYYLLCEYMPGGSLFDRHQKILSKSKRPPPPSLSDLLTEMRQISQAMEHLHSKNIVHRDLKSANVLIAANGRLCVADFGLVRYCSRETEAQMTAETGSYRWMAPEVIRHEAYGVRCDVYSFAILCYEMLTFSIPFQSHTPVEVALAVATKGLRPELPKTCPAVLAELVVRCWEGEAARRPTFTDVIGRLDAIEGAAALQELPSLMSPPSSSGASPRATSPPVPVPCDAGSRPPSSRPTRPNAAPDAAHSAPACMVAPAAAPAEAGDSRSGDKRKSPEQHEREAELGDGGDGGSGDEVPQRWSCPSPNRDGAVLKRPKSLDSLSMHVDRALQM